MSYITGGPMGANDAELDNPVAYFVWNHARTPACADVRLSASPRVPWLPFDGPGSDIHYPKRHALGFVVSRYDGGVEWARPSSLKVADFLIAFP